MRYWRFVAAVAAWTIIGCASIGCLGGIDTESSGEGVDGSGGNSATLEAPGQLVLSDLQPGATHYVQLTAKHTIRYRITVQMWGQSGRGRPTVDWSNIDDPEDDEDSLISDKQQLSGVYYRCLRKDNTYEITLENETNNVLKYTIICEEAREIKSVHEEVEGGTKTGYYYVNCYGERTYPTPGYLIYSIGSLYDCLEGNDRDSVVDSLYCGTNSPYYVVK